MRPRPARSLASTLIALALGGLCGAGIVLGWDEGRGGLILLGALLLAALPLNAAFARTAMRRRGAEIGARRDVYLGTAAVWAGIAALGLAAADAPNGWVDLAALALPSAEKLTPAFAAALAPPLAMALWARGLARDRRRRARLRRLYRGGLHLVAPRTDAELRWFRGAAAVSSAGEEIAYRLALMGTLSFWLGPWAAAGLSSLAFAAGHFYQGLRAAAVTGLFGLGAAALTLWSGSIWPAIVFHIAWNQVAAGIMRAAYRVPALAPRPGTA